MTNWIRLKNISTSTTFSSCTTSRRTRQGDGDFNAKVRALEALDARIARLLELQPDALVVAGDHSTPAILGAHSWHAVPLLIHSAWTKGEG